MVLEWGRCFLGERDLGTLCVGKTPNGGGNTGKMVVEVR